MNHRVDAFPYVLDNYLALYKFIFTLSHVLLSFTYGPEGTSFSMLFKHPVRLGTIDGHPLYDVCGIVNHIKHVSSQLSAQLDSELPRTEIQPTLIMTNEDTP